MDNETRARRVPSLVLDPEPLQRKARAWHALAALRASARWPGLQLFGGARSKDSGADAGGQLPSSEHVPDHLLTPRRNLLD